MTISEGTIERPTGHKVRTRVDTDVHVPATVLVDGMGSIVQTPDVLSDILIELRIMNMHLAKMTDETFSIEDI